MTWVGGIGAILGAICCFTPILPALLSALGLSALTGHIYRDVVLLPIIAFFLLLFGFGIWTRHRNS